MFPFLRFYAELFIGVSVKGVVSLVSFSVYLLFVYREAIYLFVLFCILLLCRWRLVLLYKIISSVNKDNLISYFPVCNPLISSSYLIVIAKTLNYME